MKAYILTLPHRTDRHEHIQQQLAAQSTKIDYEFIHGITYHREPSINIAISHKSIISIGIVQQMEKIFVLEDDCKFTSLKSLEYYFENEPKEYDMYLGGIYGSAPQCVETGRVNRFTALHCYTVHNRFYNTFAKLPVHRNLDYSLTCNGGLFIVSRPFIAAQINDYSDHAKKVVDYDHYLEGREFLQ